MSEMVPSEVSVRRSRVGFIDSDRLFRRRALLLDLIFVRGGGMFGSRLGFAHRAAELMAIRDELVRRGELSLAEDAADRARALAAAELLD